MAKVYNSEALVRLLNMLSALRELSSLSELTADEELLLDDLVVRWHQADSVTFTDMTVRHERISSSTLYRRVVTLRDKGFVSMRIDDHDKRSKLLEPTAKALEYMQRLSESLDNLIRTEKSV